MEPIRIAGKAVDTGTLRRLAREARLLEYDNLIPMELLDKLDSGGTHLLFPRADGKGIEEDAPPNPTGYRKISKLNLTLLDSVPCEVYMKLKGKSPRQPTTHMLDVSLKDFMPLTDLEDEEKKLNRVKDSQHRRH